MISQDNIKILVYNAKLNKNSHYTTANVFLNYTAANRYKRQNVFYLADTNDNISTSVIYEALEKNNFDNVVIKMDNVKRYEELSLFAKNNNKFSLYVDFVGLDLNEVAKVVNPYVRVINPSIDEKNITTVEKENRKNLSYIETIPNCCLDPNIMAHYEFLNYIDAIVYYINDKCNNDYEKIVLLSKIICKNFKYDIRFLICKKNYANKVASTSHMAESLIKYGVGVCNGISAFAEIILNHPDVNILTNSIGNDVHQWNEVKINNKWYSCDFTQNMASISPYTNFKLYNYSVKQINYFIDKVNSKGHKKVSSKFMEKLKPKSEILTEKPSLPQYRYGEFNYDTGNY